MMKKEKRINCNVTKIYLQHLLNNIWLFPSYMNSYSLI